MTRKQDQWNLTAELARLELDAEEALRLSVEAERMRELFQTMARADVENIQPANHLRGQKNIMRRDCVEPFDNVESLIDASPEEDDGLFVIPNVL